MKILALDLEGTLISNAMSQIVRPHLKFFLEEVNVKFDKIVIYTAVSEEKYNLPSSVTDGKTSFTSVFILDPRF